MELMAEEKISKLEDRAINVYKVKQRGGKTYFLK